MNVYAVTNRDLDPRTGRIRKVQRDRLVTTFVPEVDAGLNFKKQPLSVHLPSIGQTQIPLVDVGFWFGMAGDSQFVSEI